MKCLLPPFPATCLPWLFDEIPLDLATVKMNEGSPLSKMPCAKKCSAVLRSVEDQVRSKNRWAAYHSPPALSYSSPAVAYYAPPAVSYYAPPTVSYYSPPAAIAAPTTVSTYRGILPWRTYTSATYGAAPVVAPTVRYYSPFYYYP